MPTGVPITPTERAARQVERELQRLLKAARDLDAECKSIKEQLAAVRRSL